MIEVRNTKDKYKICNACLNKDGVDVKEISYGADSKFQSVFGLCKKCRDRLMIAILLSDSSCNLKNIYIGDKKNETSNM